MFDAMGVRRQDGEQGVLIYTLMKILKDKARETDDQDLLAKLNTLDEDRMVINDYLGHKPSEVIGGMTTGVLVTFTIRFIYNLLNIPL
jgi:acid phosphatase family membrane protein YuiD